MNLLSEMLYGVGKAVGDKVLMPSAAFALPSAGNSVSYNMAGMTAAHELFKWKFTENNADVAENSPPASLSWNTYDGYFTITNNGGTTSASVQPVFAIPIAKTTTAHTS